MESKDTWKTKDGRVIKIGDLENDHLANILRMMQRYLIKVAAAQYIQNLFCTTRCTADDFDVEVEPCHWYQMKEPIEKFNFEALRQEALRRNVNWEMKPELVEKQALFWETYIFGRLMDAKQLGTLEEQISRDFDELDQNESPGL